ncbi:type II toxin-antitoxin system RelE family toxin [Halosimplex pelagicum]|uniref:Type II toxin-antitoxin system RelE/ParE family toxin n=1 Tax=Halosimplex pelagicum TaxID=869886 RepID=A0A7D5TDP1_9EURY|nr:type II toxin-antitoxin system RelE/ParE family toxin [Halosimplex pelagicum]QLH83235.1 type II toxin-antitoxin system RelE/ParE family toxin [Halosimplex pelagicum]
MAEVLLSPQAREWLTDQTDDVSERVKAKLRDAGEAPGRFLKPLSGRDDYRLRIGDYRAVVDWRRDDGELRVQRIGHRDGFYE